MAEQSENLSSRNGRYWLQDMRSLAASEVPESAGAEREPTMTANEELPFGNRPVMPVSKVTRYSMHESVVVSIPDVEGSNQATAERLPQARTSEQRRSRVVAPLPKISQAETDVSRKSTLPKTKKQATLPDQDEKIQFRHSAHESATRPPKYDDAVAASRAGHSVESRDSIAKIASAIIGNFPQASPAVVMFAGTQSGIHTDESCARVAAELSGRKLGRVLLVDSDFAERRLSLASGMSTQAGLGEVMNIGYSWQKAVLKSGSSDLDFMSAGNCPSQNRTPLPALREAVAQMKQHYQFICVCTGEAHDNAASSWAGLSEGAILVVSATRSNDAIARSAVSKLKQAGARMLGCVVADVDRTVNV